MHVFLSERLPKLNRARNIVLFRVRGFRQRRELRNDGNVEIMFIQYSSGDEVAMTGRLPFTTQIQPKIIP